MQATTDRLAKMVRKAARASQAVLPLARPGRPAWWAPAARRVTRVRREIADLRVLQGSPVRPASQAYRVSRGHTAKMPSNCQFLSARARRLREARPFVMASLLSIGETTIQQEFISLLIPRAASSRATMFFTSPPSLGTHTSS